MPQNFPLDEFDRVPAHGGRHRIRRTGSVRVREWLAVFAVTLVVTGIGFYGFKILGDTNNFSGFDVNETASEPQVPGTAGPGVLVIDASGRDQIATTVASKLLQAGFNVQSARNLDALTNPGGSSSSVVYVQDASNNDEANKVAKALGGISVTQGDNFDSAITVVIGTGFSEK